MSLKSDVSFTKEMWTTSLGWNSCVASDVIVLCIWKFTSVEQRKDLSVYLLRLHLKNFVQAWNPHIQGDIDKLEIVQRMADGNTVRFEKLDYEERLNGLSLITLN